MRRQWLVALALVAAVLLAGPVLAQQAAPQEKPKEAAAADPISGSWDGTVQMSDGPMTFWMTLKLDTGGISGEIGNYEGSTGVTGTWADGKMTLTFSYVNGEPVVMTGAFKDDQFGGDLNINAGQIVTTWTAKKKA
ncbi:MAG: hypothetical protein H6Q10_2533 [Acidobacteria bacterium]|nr:hypothetical protein [Acidobacteriota bacterium]